MDIRGRKWTLICACIILIQRFEFNKIVFLIEITDSLASSCHSWPEFGCISLLFAFILLKRNLDAFAWRRSIDRRRIQRVIIGIRRQVTLVSYPIDRCSPSPAPLYTFSDDSPALRARLVFRSIDRSLSNKLLIPFDRSSCALASWNHRIYPFSQSGA